MLYLVATPIGNLGDISFRAVEALKNADYILCEDTRYSRRLLQHYQIDRPLKSFHKFNETEQEESLLADLRAGQKIALISDAGTPTLCDPGSAFVRRCRESSIPVTSLPGPCAAVVALTLSGWDPLPFQFVGFLPKKSGALDKTLQQICLYEGTTIAYESPHRIEETLSALDKIDPNRKLGIGRELTKLHEECLLGTPQDLLAHFQKHLPRGEMVLLIGRSEETVTWDALPLKEHVEQIYAQGNLSIHDAIKMVAQLRHLPKRTVYQAFHGCVPQDTTLSTQ